MKEGIEIVEKMNDALPKEYGDKYLKITENAVKTLSEYLKKNSKKGVFIRIKVTQEEEPLIEYEYNFDLEKEKFKEDIFKDIKGIKLLIDKESMKKLKGSTVDYVDTYMGSGFRVDNPNEKQFSDKFRV